MILMIGSQHLGCILLHTSHIMASKCVNTLLDACILGITTSIIFASMQKEIQITGGGVTTLAVALCVNDAVSLDPKCV